MEVKQIKQLMISMGKHGIKKLSLKKEGVELELEREPTFIEAEPLRMVANPMRGDFEKHRAHHGVVIHESPKEEEVEQEEEGEFIESPMVGTVYYSPSPNDPPYIQVGDKIDENTIVCLVEAMKVMNEVKAGVVGTITEVMVDNAHPVEFGTKLFRIAK